MFLNWGHFPKFMFSVNVTCVKTEGGAVIQKSFSDRTNVFLAMTTILFRSQTIFTRKSVEKVKIEHLPHFHDISYRHNTLIKIF